MQASRLGKSEKDQDGIVVRTDRGLCVREDSPEDVLYLYETRIALEATGARMAS